MMNCLFLNPVPLIKLGIMQGFKENGVNVFLCEGEEFFARKLPNEQYQILEKCIKKYSIDYIFLDFGYGFAFEEIYACCQKNGVKEILFGVEDIPEASEGCNCFIDYVLPYTDYYLTTTEELIPYAKKKFDRNLILFTFGVPSFLSDLVDKEEDYSYDLALVANNYSSRYQSFKDFIFPLIKEGRNLGIWGNKEWMNPNLPVNLCEYLGFYKGYFPYEDLPKLYSSTKIGLGLNCNSSSETQTSMRPYEVLGVGGSIYIAPWTKAQENLFGKSGKYCFLPKTSEEMKSNIDFVLGMPKEDRINMALKAQDMAYKKYNYKDKIANLLKTLKV